MMKIILHLDSNKNKKYQNIKIKYNTNPLLLKKVEANDNFI